jgi:glycosyltransferase involved in cell wall biosynthesis
MKKKISICVPVLNEEENIKNCFDKIKDLFDKSLKSYDYEFIFTDNNSQDKTEEIIVNLCSQHKNVKYIRFIKNINYDKSILSGYAHSTGDASLVIDCDLQDPPELIVKFIEKWESGNDLVYGKVISRDENWLTNLSRKFYYKLINYNTLSNYPENAHDFRLIDRSIIDQLKSINYIFPYVRGITFNLARNPIGVSYERKKRLNGRSKFGIYNNFAYSLNAFFEETIIFTKILRRISFFLTIIIFFLCLINLLSKFKYISFFENLMLILITLLIIFATIITEYLTRIYLQIKNIKTNYYKKKINF